MEDVTISARKKLIRQWSRDCYFEIRNNQPVYSVRQISDMIKLRIKKEKFDKVLLKYPSGANISRWAVRFKWNKERDPLISEGYRSSFGVRTGASSEKQERKEEFKQRAIKVIEERKVERENQPEIIQPGAISDKDILDHSDLILKLTQAEILSKFGVTIDIDGKDYEPVGLTVWEIAVLARTYSNISMRFEGKEDLAEDEMFDLEQEMFDIYSNSTPTQQQVILDFFPDVKGLIERIDATIIKETL